MSFKRTITSMFMVPTILNKETLKNHNFINGYAKDANKEVNYDENCIYLLFKPNNMIRFTDFLDFEYSSRDNIVEDYTYDDEYIIVVYKLDEKFKDDFNLIRQGRYSKTSLKFQDLFPKIVKDTINGKVIEGMSTQYRIFTKAEDLKKHWEEKIAVEFKDEYEIWDIYEPEKEILYIHKVKEEYERSIK